MLLGSDDCAQSRLDYSCPLVFGWRVCVTTAVILLGSALANAAGVGGGALWVPVFRFLMGFGACVPFACASISAPNSALTLLCAPQT